MNILVTGGCGFIGSHFIRRMIARYADYKLVNLDLLTYAGDLENLGNIKAHQNYMFIQGDIQDRKLVRQIIESEQIDAIVNFAAESHVDLSIREPEVFVRTNVLGTQTLLEAAKDFSIQKFVQISTDEVYGSLTKFGCFTEDSPLKPNNPYSASKAGADLLVRSYYKTYGLNVNISRSSNNYGPFQYPEKLIPLIITNALEGKRLPIYGTGENIRDWIYVEDHVAAIDLILHKGKPGEIYNVGGRNERTNNEIAKLILEQLNLSDEWIEYVQDRPGHDFRYAVNPEKIEKELGWRPNRLFRDGLKKTIQWYVEHESWWKPLKKGEKG
ncbi:dTDP-glucose 4,6-dehydratase [Bacillaceae bacterium ZC4]|uniref:dTDP-glucose 4,6-dehydratase n=1 Tax=unclassified Aeribacillus TaxID=2640495 RepID=UPI00118B8DB9|nr:dTDP-glucose 4,6-dehydratase [Bacillaceae bacterium ZC4]MDR9792540.1 dTDP-glucose 4,6-dehydratase [Aeribacillus pallidus]